MTKPDFLFNKGMRILLYSETKSKVEGASWERAGTSIAYYKNAIQRRRGTYYTLTFTIRCKCTSVANRIDDNDDLYI
jgi:hypothetical protein